MGEKTAGSQRQNSGITAENSGVNAPKPRFRDYPSSD
jgi:hypothetical protein